MIRKLSRFLGILMIVVGLFLVGRHYLSGYLVKLNQEGVSIAGLTADDLRKNAQGEGLFDYSEIRNVSEKEVRESRERIKNGMANLNVIGALAMPDCDIKVSIMKGLSEDVLLSGAGTFYADQKMGENNYPLASHNMNVIQKGLLLSPIVDKAKVGQKIYMTDLDYIYIYKVDFAQAVDPTRFDLVQLASQKPMVTLMTCTDDATSRMIVQGKLEKKVAFNKADKKLLSLFDDEKK